MAILYGRDDVDDSFLNDAAGVTNGDDVIYGFGGNDQIFGAGGNDLLIGGSGADGIQGGEGIDTVDYSASPDIGLRRGVFIDLAGNIARFGDAQGDQFSSIENVIGGAFGDEIIGTDAANMFIGGQGDDRLTGGLGADHLIGGSGIDTAGYADSGVAVTVSLDSGAATGGTAAGDVFDSIENLVGSPQGDTLSGDEGNNRVEGGGGADYLKGVGGNDVLDGGLGDDVLEGNAGNDTYFVNSLGDVVDEDRFGDGQDLVMTSVAVDLTDLARFKGDIEDVTVTSSSGLSVLGNGLANRLTGGAGNDSLNGGVGADVLAGAGGDDTYVNPDGDTVVEAAGAAGGLHDRVVSRSSFSLASIANVEDLALNGGANVNGIGNNAGNRIVGNVGNNILNGGGGNDTLTGGAGNDTMNGGSGADIFRFVGDTDADRIAGFERTVDRFDLGGGSFSTRVESAGSTTLTHAGGTILVSGVTGLSLAGWNALVMQNGWRAQPDHAFAVTPPLDAHPSAHPDFLLA